MLCSNSVESAVSPLSVSLDTSKMYQRVNLNYFEHSIKFSLFKIHIYMYLMPCLFPVNHFCFLRLVLNFGSNTKRISTKSHYGIDFFFSARVFFFLGGTGGSLHPVKMLSTPPPSDTCPRFWTKACPLPHRSSSPKI